MFAQPIKFPSVFGFVTVDEIGEDYREGSQRCTWAFGDGRIDRSYSSRVKVSTLTKVGPLAIMAILGVRIGDSYRFPLYSGSATEADTGSFVQSIAVDKDSEDGKQWSVTIDYTPNDIATLHGNAYVSQGILDPTARVWEVYWDAAKYRLSKPEDNSDPPLPYINMAGDPLLDPPEYEETRPVLKLVHFEPKYNEAVANSFRDTTNADMFLGCPPNSVKCRDIRGELHWDTDWGIVWQVSYEFEFRVDAKGDGFAQKLINAGYRYKKNGTGNPINATDDNGSEAKDIILLQRNGDKLAAGADPYLLTFTEFPTSDFSLLGIPDDILEKSSW
jgi:hypothetical protein